MTARFTIPLSQPSFQPNKARAGTHCHSQQAQNHNGSRIFLPKFRDDGGWWYYSFYRHPAERRDPSVYRQVWCQQSIEDLQNLITYKNSEPFDSRVGPRLRGDDGGWW